MLIYLVALLNILRLGQIRYIEERPLGGCFNSVPQTEF